MFKFGMLALAMLGLAACNTEHHMEQCMKRGTPIVPTFEVGETVYSILSPSIDMLVTNNNYDQNTTNCTVSLVITQWHTPKGVRSTYTMETKLLRHRKTDGG